ELWEYNSQSVVDGERGVGVGAGDALVDDGDRDAQLDGPDDEPAAGHDHQRRAQDEQGVGPLDQRVGGNDAVRRHGFAEEHDVRLEDPAQAGQALDDREVAQRLVPELDVTVGVDRARLGLERRVGEVQPLVQLLAGGQLAAAEAGHVGEAAVQLDHFAGAGGLVEAVDVLGDDAVDEAGLLELGDGLVPGVGGGFGDRLPAEVAAGPVSPAGGRVTGERLVGHRGRAAPAAARAAVVRDA